MKTIKKLIYTTAIAFMSLSLNAQLKVWSSPAGYVGIGSTSTTPSKPLDVIGSGGIQVSQTDSANTDNELLFKDNGQIRSGTDNNHRIIFYRSANILELREFGNIIFSPGSSGTRTQKVVFTNTGNVGIGVGTSLTANTKFDLLYSTGSAFTSGQVYGGHFINSNTASSTNPYPYVYGVYGESSSTESYAGSWHYGGSFKASNAYNCVGVSGVAASIGAYYTYGGYFNASGAFGGNIYGIYATAPVQSMSYAAWLNGTVYVNGSGTYTGTWTLSDRQFKTNINAIPNPSVILNKLKPQSFYFDTANTVGMNFSGKKQYGFIAQDLQQVLPELVQTVTRPAIIDTDGNVTHAAVTHLAVNYNAFFGLLTAGYQAQQGKIDSLITKTTKYDSVIAAMQQQLNTCCAATTTQRTIQGTGDNKNIGTVNTIELASGSAIIYQNAPNPFGDGTMIKYFVPENTTNAQIVFYDEFGSQLKTFAVTETGAGQLNITSANLAPGTYSYSLIINGKVIDTKKMIKTN